MESTETNLHRQVIKGTLKESSIRKVKTRKKRQKCRSFLWYLLICFSCLVYVHTMFFLVSETCTWRLTHLLRLQICRLGFLFPLLRTVFLPQSSKAVRRSKVKASFQGFPFANSVLSVIFYMYLSRHAQAVCQDMDKLGRRHAANSGLTVNPKFASANFSRKI